MDKLTSEPRRIGGAQECFVRLSFPAQTPSGQWSELQGEERLVILWILYRRCFHNPSIACEVQIILGVSWIQNLTFKWLECFRRIPSPRWPFRRRQKHSYRATGAILRANWGQDCECSHTFFACTYLFFRILLLNSSVQKLDSNDLSRMSYQHLRSNIALVGQEPVLFRGTIRENVTMGMEGGLLLFVSYLFLSESRFEEYILVKFNMLRHLFDSETSLDDVIAACRLANAANFIEQFPLVCLCIWSKWLLLSWISSSVAIPYL